jgi:hypothetical protein
MRSITVGVDPSTEIVSGKLVPEKGGWPGRAGVQASA